MQDLKSAKLKDNFLLRSGERVEIVMIDGNDYVVKSEVNGLMMMDISGAASNSLNDIVSKHEPRPWLKLLPDADIFEDDIYLYCSFSGRWGYSKHSRRINQYGSCWAGSITLFSAIKMPTLTGEQWKLSKISIPDLKAWQLENKQ